MGEVPPTLCRLATWIPLGKAVSEVFQQESNTKCEAQGRSQGAFQASPAWMLRMPFLCSIPPCAPRHQHDFESPPGVLPWSPGTSWLLFRLCCQVHRWVSTGSAPGWRHACHQQVDFDEFQHEGKVIAIGRKGMTTWILENLYLIPKSALSF